MAYLSTTADALLEVGVMASLKVVSLKLAPYSDSLEEQK